jgi:calcium/calmodulin-dependent protein kinase I
MSLAAIEQLEPKLGPFAVESLKRIDAVLTKIQMEALAVMEEKELPFLKISRKSVKLDYSLYCFKGPAKGECKVFAHLGKRTRIGEGRYKVVTQAVDMTTYTLVALSKIRYDDLEKAKNGIKEKEMLRSMLGSERIISSEYFGERYKSVNLLKHYIFTVLCDLGRLSEWTRVLTPQEKIVIAIDTVQAVAELHARGKVHHDIKPDNILLYTDTENRKRALLADLGYAKDKTEPMSNAGSPSWIAPEKFRRCAAGIALTFEESILTDVWSTGVTLYDLFIDPIKFRSLLNAVPQKFTLIDLAKVYEEFHPTWQGTNDIERLIHSMLENDPSQRMPLSQVLTKLKNLTV